MATGAMHDASRGMLRTMRQLAVMLFVLSILPRAASAESMRCGKWVVGESSSAAEILEKCGEPQKKDISHEDVYTRNALGSTNKIGVKVTERWRYQASNRVLPMLVTIVDGKVVSLERTE